MAFLKKGWFDKGCAVAEFCTTAFVWKLAVSKVVACVALTDELVVEMDSLPFLPPFANFLSRGLACCCSSVNTGLRDTTFVWIDDSWENNAKNYTPLCWTSGSQCSLLRWQIIWTYYLTDSYLTASFAIALSMTALDLLLDVEKCLLMASKSLFGSFPAFTRYSEN